MWKAWENMLVSYSTVGTIDYATFYNFRKLRLSYIFTIPK